MNLKKIKDTLRVHLENCEIAYSLLLEENSILKREGKPPAEEFLKKKRILLPQLEESINALKDLRETCPIRGAQNRKLIDDTQKKLMKIFLLDRENEQLLLKMSFSFRPQNKDLKISPAQLRNTYKR